jgi:hypothetical protein
MAEALCLNVPIVVYRGILGGWKYVNGFTGTFFEGEHDVTSAVRNLNCSRLAPRAWFRANYGPYRAGKKLLSLVRAAHPTLREESHLRLDEARAERPAAR